MEPGMGCTDAVTKLINDEQEGGRQCDVGSGTRFSFVLTKTFVGSKCISVMHCFEDRPSISCSPPSASGKMYRKCGPSVLDQTSLHSLDGVDDSGPWSVDSVCSSPVLTVPTREDSSELSPLRNCSVERSAARARSSSSFRVRSWHTTRV